MIKLFHIYSYSGYISLSHRDVFPAWLPLKLVPAICHGGWIAISAGVYENIQVTGSPGIKDDLVNAGALWQDAAVVEDKHFISSRRPSDLPLFMEAIVRWCEKNPSP